MDADAGLPPEMAALRRTARDFASREIRPRVQEMEQREHIPDELISKLGEVGFFGTPFPPEWGGAGLGEIGLEALQVSVTATKEQATVEGMLPLDASEVPKDTVGLSPLNKHRHHDVDITVVANGAQHAGAR